MTVTGKIASNKTQTGYIMMWSAVALAYLPHTLYQTWLINVFCLSVLLWRLLSIAYGVKAPPRTIIYALAILATTTIIFTDPIGLSKNAGIAILCLALAVNQLYIDHSTDALNITGIALFVACLALLNTDSSYIIIFVTLSLYLMVMSLVCLHGGARNIAGTFSLAHKLILCSIPLALVLFYFVPTNFHNHVKLTTNAGTGVTGLGNTISPGSISKLQKNNDVAFRVRFERLPDDLNKLYWRGPVFSFYNGQTWNKNSFSEQQFIRAGTRPEFDSSLANREKYQVIIPAGFKWAIALDRYSHFDVPIYTNSDGERILVDSSSKPVAYQVVSGRKVSHDKIEDVFHIKNLQLPNLYSYKTRQLVKQWMNTEKKRVGSDKRIVEKALAFFRQNPFYYSLTPAPIKYDPVDEFLFNTREGYCEHYASAFVFMMRAAGIPSRIVTGYYGGEYNAIDEYLVIRQSNAHAWAEVWIGGQGWTRVDPTSVIPNHRVKVDIAEFENTMSINKNWIGSLIDVAMFRANQFTADIGTYLSDMAAFCKKMVQNIFSPTRWILIIIISAMVCTGYIRFWRPGTLCISKYYEQQFCNKFSRFGIHKQNGETPTTFARRVLKVRPDLKLSVDNITKLYNQLRYSKHVSDDELRMFRQTVRKLRI